MLRNAQVQQEQNFQLHCIGADESSAETFICQDLSWSIKGDRASMDVPIFSLSKIPVTQQWEHRRGNQSFRVIPSSEGAATIFDKDLLLYVASQIIGALNQGKPVSRTVEINSMHFLLWAKRGDGRASFENIVGMLRRLKGTVIETNVRTGDVLQSHGFSLIDSYRILSKRTREKLICANEAGKVNSIEIPRVLRFSVTLSEWLFNALTHFEVLTLNPDYFELTKSVDRQLYQIARRHCGKQPMWKINIDLLAEKVGIRSPRFKFRNELRRLIKNDGLPDYHVALDTNASPDFVLFYSRDLGKITLALCKDKNLSKWFMSLEHSKKISG